eukprot:scaffold171735_cov18-Prasinocladus_malaysianus.AAC.2
MITGCCVARSCPQAVIKPQHARIARGRGRRLEPKVEEVVHQDVVLRRVVPRLAGHQRARLSIGAARA